MLLIFFACFTWLGLLHKNRSNLRTRTKTLIQVLSSACCKLNLHYRGRDRHPQSHLCNASCTLSVEQVSCTMTCKVSLCRFIPPSRKMQSTQKSINNKSINAHKNIVFYSCNNSMHRHSSDTTVGVRSMENKKFLSHEHTKAKI